MNGARYTIDFDLHGKLLKIINLQVDSQLKSAQHAFLPWQFMVSAVAVGITAGVGLMGAVFTLVRCKVGG